MSSTHIIFYKCKLWSPNFIVYDSPDLSAHCIMWHESKGGWCDNEIATVILKWDNSIFPGSTVDRQLLQAKQKWSSYYVFLLLTVEVSSDKSC